MLKLFRGFLAVLFLFSALAGALAEGTHTWEQSKYDELEKGTAHGVAIRSEGGLELAPAFKALYTTPSTYIWSIAADAQGNVYAAAGSPPRVYRVTPQGQASIIFQPEELQVQALVVDKSGAIYAATSPDGKVYKIEHTGASAAAASRPASDSAPSDTPKTARLDPSYSARVFFDPGTKYIWDLVEDSQGRLYVATGDRGEIFRVDKDGNHSLFFKSDEAHIRVLALDSKGNLIAGSDGSGLVYRISPDGNAFVLYSAPKKEITALAIDAKGNIYAAGVGEKRAVTAPSPLTSLPQNLSAPAPTTLVIGAQGPGPAANPIATLSAPMPFPGLGAAGSEIYQIAPDGSPTRIWSSREDVVYALAFDQRGRLLAGTGNKGRIFAIEGQNDYTDLVKASATQVAAMVKAPNGGLYAATSNLGKIFLLGGAPQEEASYESDIFDAHIFSRWGRVEVHGAGSFDLLARSGNVDNPDRNWSPWKPVDLRSGAELGVPPARFVQWKVVMHPGATPADVESVVVNYLPKNVAPEIDDIAVQTGARFQNMPKPANDTITVNVGGSNSTPPRFEPMPTAVRDRDSIAVRWNAHDDNDDDLVYSLYYRGDGETRWQLLKDEITDKFYSFDASLLPDGGYTLRVIASDAPSHSPDEALTASRDSSRFEVDTTPPQVENLTAAMESAGGKLHIRFRAADTFSPIKRAEYSVDAGDWQFVEPVGQLSDARTENYDFSVPVPADDPKPATAAGDDPVMPGKAAAQEHVVVVRVYDRFDNMAAAKTVLRAK